MPQALVVLASLREQSGDLTAAIRGYREALELSPTLALAHSIFGDLQVQADRASDGLRHMERAIQLEPTNAQGYVIKSNALGLLGQVEAARSALAEAARLGGAVTSLYVEMRCAFWWSDRTLAGEVANRIEQLPPNNGFGPAVTTLRALAEGKVFPVEHLQSVWATVAGPDVAPRRRVSVGTYLVDVATWAGYPEQALDRLESLVPMPFVDLTWLDLSPNIKPLRADPRFARVRAQVAERVAELWR
jgi:tetratricopeptide (TPR) repeat protein